MKLTSNSIKFNLGLIIGLMGLLGLILALSTGRIYRNMALESQELALSRMIELETADLLDELHENTADLALTLQRDRSFRDHLGDRNIHELTRGLDNQFHQYFVTADIVRLTRLYVYDEYFSLITASTEHDPHIRPDAMICPDLLTRAKRRHGASRLQILSELCLYEGRPQFAIVVPAGGLKISGYIVVIADPAHNLKGISGELGLPLQLSLRNGDIVYTDDTWPGTEDAAKMLNISHEVKTHFFETALVVSIVYDLTELNAKLDQATALVILIATISTGFAILISLFSFNSGTLRPLRSLTRQLRQVHNDKTHLGEQLKITGSREIVELSENFNAMSMQLKELYDTLENQAFTDALTQLPNRTLFHDRLHHATLLCARNNGHFALMMMDLDRFKEINDTLGHQFGDQLLQQVSARLNKVLRRSDTLARLNDSTVARLGGDEFAAILPDVDTEQDAISVAQKIQRVMTQAFEIEGHSLHADLSIGIVMYPKHGSEGQILLQRADIAMYQAKHNHQGFALYDIRQDSNSLSHLTMISDLRRALDEGGLVLHYQPKIRLTDRTVCGLEALVRWNHPEKGLIAPDSFIPLAEHTGLIKPLTNWILGQAIRDCATIQQHNYPLHMSVNISVRSLYDNNLIDSILALLRKHELDGKWLNLELTESAVMADSSRAMKMLSMLSNSKIMLSIDDFGTGYSSLSHLKKLPINEIKIDRSFVMDMRENNNDAVIVRSTIDLAHNMGLGVTAEGVDSAESCQLLRDLSCDMVQGFFIARPMPYVELMNWLQTSSWAARLKAGGTIRLIKS